MNIHECISVFLIFFQPAWFLYVFWSAQSQLLACSVTTLSYSIGRCMLTSFPLTFGGIQKEASLEHGAWSILGAWSIQLSDAPSTGILFCSQNDAGIVYVRWRSGYDLTRLPPISNGIETVRTMGSVTGPADLATIIEADTSHHLARYILQEQKSWTSQSAHSDIWFGRTT